MLVIVLAVSAAVIYGVSDFFGGIAARRLTTLRSTLVMYALAAVAILAAWPFAPGAITPGSAVAGSVAGVFAIGGFLAFYAALSIGPISVLSPLIAVLSSLVPVVVALVAGEVLSPLAVAAIALAVIAAALISVQHRDSTTRVSARALLLAVAAGLGLGLSVAALDFAPAGSGLVPAVFEILVGLVIVAVVVGLVRPQRPTGALGRARVTAVVGGLLLGVSNALIVLALAAGELAIVSVLVGLYPVSTIILAALVLRERMSRPQVVGVVLAVAASVLLALS
jgi:drug/metabolite transporter (DMT)-like permease